MCELVSSLAASEGAGSEEGPAAAAAAAATAAAAAAAADPLKRLAAVGKRHAIRYEVPANYFAPVEGAVAAVVAEVIVSRSHTFNNAGSSSLGQLLKAWREAAQQVAAALAGARPAGGMPLSASYSY